MYCDADGSVHVSKEDLSACPKCGARSGRIDTLDTWFSSGLGRSRPSGGPTTRPTFAPTIRLPCSSGADIIFFWVARMAMLGIHFMKDVPSATCTCTLSCATPKARDVEVKATWPIRSSSWRSTAPTRFASPWQRSPRGATSGPGPHRGLSQLRQQDLERFASGPLEPGRLRPGAGQETPPASPTCGSSRLAATVAEARTALKYRFSDGVGALVPLARVLRLVSRILCLALSPREPGPAGAPGDAR